MSEWCTNIRSINTHTILRPGVVYINVYYNPLFLTYQSSKPMSNLYTSPSINGSLGYVVNYLFISLACITMLV